MYSVPEASLYRPTFATIDLDAYASNIRAVAAMLPDGASLAAVLKADGYGHGAAELAHVASEEGVRLIAVALLEEAIELRRSGIDLPILVLGPLSAEQLPLVEEWRVTPGVPGPESLRELVQSRRPFDIHLKLDSGMSRMGVIESELPEVIEMLRGSSLRVTAIYTHFASASDPSSAYTDRQRESLASMLRTLRDAGIDPPLLHSANSAATVRRIVAPGEIARVGLSLLGAEALDEGESRLEPVLSWTTRIVRLKEVAAGVGVGYGTTYTTTRTTRIATLPVGYADGYDRLLSNRGEVLVGGVRVPVIGRVSMDLVTIDVTDVSSSVGDEVVLLGRQGDERITAEDHAVWTSTIPYEVFCRISARVPRIYTRGERTWMTTKFKNEAPQSPGKST